MDILFVIAVLCFITVCIISLVPDCKPPEEEMETVLTNLFHDYVDLNDDAFDAYKALIQASFNESQTRRQDKRWK
jgi:hypothetical protein